MRLRSGGLLAGVLALAAAPACANPPDDPTALASRARAVLEKHCNGCHGDGGSAKGGFGYVLDREKLVGRQKVVPGSPGESDLFQRIVSGEMPPPSSKKPRPDKDEVELLRKWIAAGAPGVKSAVARVEFVPHGEMVRGIVADLEAFPARQRRYYRYLTLTSLLNSGASDADLDTNRKAIAKLVNALSTHPRITLPVAIDAARTVYRIDLRDYRWTGSQWDRLVSAYPYRLEAPVAEARAFAAMTGSELPHLRGDWFVATASRPPLYYDLLGLPNSERGLERLLQVDSVNNIKEETAVRAGFNDSGVSKNNRLLERHDAAFGAYWRSYDFDSNFGRQNLFEHPLGPGTGETSFKHAGGEMIYHLPNGLHGYFLADAIGRRIDKGPTEIVADPKRPDQRVEAGVSCMSCHARGLLPKADQVRAHVEKNRKAFPRADLESVVALYAPKARFQALLDEDNKRYLQSLKSAGVSADDPEPVNAVTQRYEGTLDLRAAAAEFVLPVQQLAAILRKSRELARPLGALATNGGTVQRQLFEQSFAEAQRILRQLDAKAATTQEGPKPFTGHTGSITAIARSPDGKRVATGGEDRTVRIWTLPDGKEVARLQGHTDEVTAVAFSPDSRYVLSGSRDRTVRLWNAAAGEFVRALRGHTAAVRCVAFDPDGKHAASGDDDHAIRVWDLGGKELKQLSGHSGAVRSLAYAANGWLVSGGHDKTVRVWDRKGKEVASLSGHTREVLAVAFSADGKRIISGGNDRSVRLWDVADRKQLAAFEGHANAVIAVAFAADGKQVVSASSQYQTPDRVIRVWNLADRREANIAWAGEERGVGCVAFGPTGYSAVAAGGERHWSHWQFGK